MKFVVSLTVPIYWILPEGGGYRARNGSAFFLHTGERLFAVTPRCT